MPVVRGFDFPADLWYLMEQDTWARLDADGLATIGITSLGAHISGDFIESFIAKPRAPKSSAIARWAPSRCPR